MRRLLAFALAALVPSLPVAAQSTPHEKLAHEIYKELIEINTVDSVGSVTKAVEALAARFKAEGFPDSDIHVLIPDNAPTKGNIVVRLHGRGGPNAPKPILLLAHLDVVAALRSDWPRDPFTLNEENGFFLGRGTADDKSMASAFAANMIWMKREGFVPDRDIIMALTADEEGGGSNGARTLATQHKDWIDAAYAINEGGDGSLSLVDAKPISNGLMAAEKVSVNFTFAAHNTGGHSSMPRPDNAIYELSKALLKVSEFEFPVVLNPVTTAYLTQSAKVQPDKQFAAAELAVVKNPQDPKANAILAHDSFVHSVLRTTCVATRLAGGHANNALPQTATANVNCRVEPTSSYEYVLATLRRVVGDTGIAITMQGRGTGVVGAPPSAVPTEFLDAVTAVTRKLWGDIPVVPQMSTGATDGRYLRQVGIPTFGVSGMMYQGEERNMHGRDEKIRVKSYYDGLKFLDELVRTLSTKTSM